MDSFFSPRPFALSCTSQPSRKCHLGCSALRFTCAAFIIASLVTSPRASIIALACAHECPSKPVTLLSRAIPPSGSAPRALGLRLPDRPSVVLVRINAAGHPTSTKIISSSGDRTLDRAAERIAMKSTYSPASKGCHYLPAWYRLTQKWTGDAI